MIATQLEAAFDKASQAFAAIRALPIIRQQTVDIHSADDLRELATVATGIGCAVADLLREIAIQACLDDDAIAAASSAIPDAIHDYLASDLKLAASGAEARAECLRFEIPARFRLNSEHSTLNHIQQGTGAR